MREALCEEGFEVVLMMRAMIAWNYVSRKPVTHGNLNICLSENFDI